MKNLLESYRNSYIDKCIGPTETGPCKNFLYKWSFDHSLRECSTFIWGGCDGNPNNRFNTEAECNFHCLGEPCNTFIDVKLE